MGAAEIIAMASLKARYFDPEPEMYEGSEAEFWAGLDKGTMADALHEARAALKALEDADYEVRKLRSEEIVRRDRSEWPDRQATPPRSSRLVNSVTHYRR